MKWEPVFSHLLKLFIDTDRLKKKKEKRQLSADDDDKSHSDQNNNSASYKIVS